MLRAELHRTTSEGVRLSDPLAGAPSRVGAAALDLGLMLAAYLLVVFLSLAIASADPTGLSGLVQGMLLGGFPLVLIGTHCLVLKMSGGRSPGKAAFRLRVVADDGGRAPTFSLFVRSMFLPVDIFPVVAIPVGVISIVLTGQRQRLGDWAAGTVVVREERRWSRAEPFDRESWDPAKSRLGLTPGLAARFDEQDLDFLRALWERTDLGLEQRRDLFVRAARHYAERLELSGFDDSRELLKELFLFLRAAR